MGLARSSLRAQLLRVHPRSVQRATRKGTRTLRDKATRGHAIDGWGMLRSVVAPEAGFGVKEATGMVRLIIGAGIEGSLS